MFLVFFLIAFLYYIMVPKVGVLAQNCKVGVLDSFQIGKEVWQENTLSAQLLCYLFTHFKNACSNLSHYSLHAYASAFSCYAYDITVLCMKSLILKLCSLFYK